MSVRSLLTSITDPIAHAEALDGPTAAITAFSERLPLPRPPAYVHPKLVLVPLTAWGSAKAFDLIGDRPAAQAVIGVGVLAAIPTAITGHEDWMHTATEAQRVASVHAAVQNLAISAYASSWFARRAGNHRAGMVLSWSGALLLALGVVLGLDADRRGRGEPSQP